MAAKDVRSQHIDVRCTKAQKAAARRVMRARGHDSLGELVLALIAEAAAPPDPPTCPRCRFADCECPPEWRDS
jgi:hypothetical protein